MKNSVFYKDSWLKSGSRAKELWDEWNKTRDTKDKQKLDKHVKEVDLAYKKLTGLI